MVIDPVNAHLTLTYLRDALITVNPISHISIR